MDPTGLGEVDRPSVLENFEAKTKYMVVFSLEEGV